MDTTPREYAEDMEPEEGRCPDCGGQVLAEGDGPDGSAGMCAGLCVGCNRGEIERIRYRAVRARLAQASQGGPCFLSPAEYKDLTGGFDGLEPSRVDQASRDADESIEALVREIERLWWPDAESPVCTTAGVRRVELRWFNGRWHAHDACARPRSAPTETLTVGVIKVEVPAGYGDESIAGER